MKKLFTTLAVWVFSIAIFGQAFDWEWQNPKPHSNALRAVKVFDANTLVAFGAGGVMQKSIDGGATWSVNYADAAGREFRSADFVNSSVGYACGASGLLMKTTDGGISAFDLNPSTTELLYDIDFIDADTGFVVGNAGTVLKTTNGGTTWAQVTTPVTNAIYAVCAEAPDNIFIGTASSGATQRLSRSTDYGVTWVDITPSGLTQTIWDICFINSTTGWIATQNGGRVYYTTDAGATWGNTVVNGLIVPNTVKFKDALTGFVTNNNNGTLYKTTDGGLTWTGYAAGDQPLYCADVSGNFVLAGGRYGSTYKSSDGGETCTPAYQCVTHTQLRDIEFHNSTTGLVAGGSSTASDSSGFLLKTTDGGNTWVDVGYNFKFQVYSFTRASDNVWYVGRGRNGLFKTTDGGASFTEQTHPLTSATAHFQDIAAVDENTVYAFHSSGGIIKTTNGGTSWENANTPFGTSTVYAGHVFDANKVIAVGLTAKAFMTTDGGANWTALNVGTPGNFFAVRFLNENFGIIAGFNSPNSVAIKTTDGGATWTTINLPAEYTGSIWGIGFKNESKFWLSDGSGNIFYTNDGGATWSESKKIATNSIFSISIVGNDMWLSGTGGTILKGFSDSSVPVELVSFSAAVSGKSVNLVWKTATETNNNGFGIERKFVNENWKQVGFINGKGTTTEASQYSYTDKPEKAGVVQYRLKQMDFDGTFEYSKIVELNLSTPDKFELAQNYPNPFNPVTSIKYSLIEKSKVDLKIYNILGKEVAHLVNEMQEAGSYEVKFNADQLTSGVYIYELNAGAFTAQRKMILIK